LPRSPLGRIYTKFGTAVWVADVITSNNFLVIGQGVWILCGVKNCPLPLTKPVSDAMLARVLAMALSLSVNPSVCLLQLGVLSKRMDESCWFLAWELPSTHPTLCSKEIQGHSKIRVLSSWNFATNSGLRKFRHNISIVKACYQHSSRKADAQAVVDQLS